MGAEAADKLACPPSSCKRGKKNLGGRAAEWGGDGGGKATRTNTDKHRRTRTPHFPCDWVTLWPYDRRPSVLVRAGLCLSMRIQAPGPALPMAIPDWLADCELGDWGAGSWNYSGLLIWLFRNQPYSSTLFMH